MDDATHLDVAVHNVVVMEVAETVEDLAGVEDDGGFIVLQGSPLGAQQGRETPWRGGMEWGSTFRPRIWWPRVPPLAPRSPSQCCSPPGTSSMKILMKPSWLMEPRYRTMFLCRRRLCSAISSCKGCEYLCGGTWG